MSRRGHSRVKALLEPLVGQHCSLVDTSFGGELVVGYGPLGTALSPLGRDDAAEWMLFTRGTPWVVDTVQGVVSVSNGSLSDDEVQKIREAFVGKRVTQIEVRNAALGLSVVLDGTDRFELLPRAEQTAEREAETWELRTPDNQVVLAYGGWGIRIVPGTTPVSELATYPVLPVDTTVIRSLVSVAASKGPPNPLVDLRRALTRVCRELPALLYERRVGEDPSPDFYVIPEKEPPISIEVKLVRGEGQYKEPLHVLLVSLVPEARRAPIQEVPWRREALEDDLREAFEDLLKSS